VLGRTEEEEVWRTVWEVVGREGGLGGVEWWVNGGRERVLGRVGRL
jgi:hypothetical protein